MIIFHIFLACLVATLANCRPVSQENTREIESYNRLIAVHGDQFNLWYFPSNSKDAKSKPLLVWFGDGKTSALVDSFTSGGPYELSFAKPGHHHHHHHHHPTPSPCCKCNCPPCPNISDIERHPHHHHRHHPHPPHCPPCPTPGPINPTYSSSSSSPSSASSSSASSSSASSSSSPSSSASPSPPSPPSPPSSPPSPPSSPSSSSSSTTNPSFSSTTTEPPAVGSSSTSSGDVTTLPPNDQDSVIYHHHKHHHHKHHHHPHHHHRHHDCCPCNTSTTDTSPFRPPKPDPKHPSLDIDYEPSDEGEQVEFEFELNPDSWTGNANVLYFDFAGGFARPTSNDFQFHSALSHFCRQFPSLIGSDLYLGGKNLGAGLAAEAFEEIHNSNLSELNLKGFVFSLFSSEEDGRSELIEDVTLILNNEEFKEELGREESEIWYPFLFDSLKDDRSSYERILKFVERNSAKFNAIVSGRDLTVADLTRLTN